MPSCLRRDSEEDAELSCARGGCLASRVASCSCELLTDGRWGRRWLGEWRAGLEGMLVPGWPDRLMCFPPATSPAGDLPRPPETVAAVVTAPHSRARDGIGESLVHVPLETFLETLESPGGSGRDSNNTGVHNSLLSLDFLPANTHTPGHRGPQSPSEALPEPQKP